MSLLKQLAAAQHLQSLSPSSLVSAAAELMAERHIGSVVITENTELVGIFTERDLLNRVVARGLDPRTTPLSVVMTTDISTIDVNDGVDACFGIMQRRGCRHLPIVENGKLVGIVSIRNVLDWIIHDLEIERDMLRQYISE